MSDVPRSRNVSSRARVAQPDPNVHTRERVESEIAEKAKYSPRQNEFSSMPASVSVEKRKNASVEKNQQQPPSERKHILRTRRSSEGSSEKDDSEVNHDSRASERAGHARQGGKIAVQSASASQQPDKDKVTAARRGVHDDKTGHNQGHIQDEDDYASDGGNIGQELRVLVRYTGKDNECKTFQVYPTDGEEKQLWMFACYCPDLRKKLVEELTSDAVVVNCSDSFLEIIINNEIKNEKKVGDSVKQIINECCKHIVGICYTIPPDAMKSLIAEIDFLKSGKTSAKKATHFASKMANLYFSKTSKTCILLAVPEAFKESENVVDTILGDFPDSFQKWSYCIRMHITTSLPVKDIEVLRLFDQFPCYVEEGVSASCDFERKCIEIQGEKEKADIASMNIKESIENVQSRRINIPKYHTDFFKQPIIQQYVNLALEDQNLHAHWTVRSGSIEILSWPSEKIDHADFTVRGCYCTEEIPNVSNIQSNLWSKIHQKLKDWFGEKLSVIADIPNDCLAAVSFVCTADIADQCRQAIHDDLHVSLQERRTVISIKEWKHKFLEKYPAALNEIEEKTGAKITPEKKDDGYLYRVNGVVAETLEDARNALKGTLKSLHKEHIDIDEKFKKGLDTADGKTWIKKLEKESNVMLEVEEPNDGRPNTVQIMVEGTECEVVLTTCKNTENAVLVEPCYGKKSICMDDIGRRGQVTASLYWPQTIRWESNFTEMIKQNLRNLFSLCDERQQSAVFFPLNKFGKVHKTLDELVNLIILEFTKMRQKPRKHDTDLILYTDDPAYYTKLVNNVSEQMSDKSVISIVVKQGSLAQQKVDVVVSSVDGRTLNLNHGAVSSALLKVAGQQMQKEVTENYPKGIQPGEIARTKGYNLPCKYVFHSFLTQWNAQISGSQLKSAKMLHSIVWKCLAAMDSLHLHTIEFPALGTGQLLYPCNVVAEEMFQTVENYRRHNPNTGVKEVTFVVYQTGEMHSMFMKEKDKWEKRSVSGGGSDESTYRLTIVGNEENVCQVKAHIEQRKVSGVKIKGHAEPDIGRQLSEATGRPVTRAVMGTGVAARGAGVAVRGAGVATRGTGVAAMNAGVVAMGAIPKSSPRQAADGGNRRSMDPRSQRSASSYSLAGGPGDVVGMMGVQVTKKAGPGPKRPHTGQNGSKKTLNDFLVDPRVELSKQALRLAAGKEKHIQKQLEDNYGVKVDLFDGKITVHADLSTIEKLESTLTALITSSCEQISDNSDDSDIESNCDSDLDNENTPEDDASMLVETLKSYTRTTDTSISICDVRQEVYESLMYFYKDNIEEFREKNVTFKYLDNRVIIFSEDKRELQNAKTFILKLIEDIDEFYFKEFMLETNSADQIIQVADQMKLEHHWQDIFLYKVDKLVVILVGPAFDYVYSFEELLKARCKGRDVGSRQGRNLTVDIPPREPTSAHKEKATWQESSERADKKRQNIPVRRAPSTEIPANAKIFETEEGMQVYVYRKSLLCVDADCIVNAANSSLKHGGGIAKAIAKAAGPQLVKESDVYIEKNGSLPVGQCCITTAGWLKYQCVIHAVGPRQRAYPRHQRDQMQNDLCNAVQRSFIKAKDEGCYSIGVPSISSGIFAVPKGCCALQYGRAVKEYSQRYGRHDSLQEIHFVDIDDEMLQFISVAFDFVINGNTSAEQKLAELEKNKTKKWYQRVKKTPKTKLAQPLGTEALHFTVSGRDVVLKTGDLVEFGEGVIVCSQKHPFDIVGGVAKAIQKRHPNFLKELKGKMEKEPAQPGDIFVASSGSSLRCAHIYNVVVPHKNEEQFSTLLIRCYFNVFKKAEDGGIRKIALPLLATGRRGAKADLSARCLMNALMNLNQPRKLKEIHVINNRMDVTETVRRVLSETRDDGQVPGWSPDDRRHGRSPVHKFEDVPTTPPIYSDKEEDIFSTIREIKNLNRSSTNSGDNNRESDDNAYAEIGSGERNTPDRTKFGSSEKLCPICLDPIEGGRTLSKCGHVFHGECIDECFKHKPVCPTCGAVYGELTGNQPYGTMNDHIEEEPLPGYGKYRTIVIKYQFDGGTQLEGHPEPGQRYTGTRRTAYLPDSPEGRMVLKLLKVAFKRKLIFTVGRSVSSGEENTVTWNDIHHKTKRTGGAQHYGYPDPEYLGRVREELAIKGVTEESL